LLRAALGGAGPPEYIFVSEAEIHEQGLHIEHGHQRSFDNRFGMWPVGPFFDDAEGRRRLERPWGTLFLDLIYNDIAQRYPFTNRVYPIARLALIALRSQISWRPASRRLLAHLVAFFLTKGKRSIASHLLEVQPAEVPAAAVPLDEIEAFLAREVPGLPDDARAEVATEAARLIDGSEDDSDASPPVFEGFLQGGDEEGLDQHAKWVLESGDVQLIVFGHTHVLVDGNLELVNGPDRPERVFNTGCWIPRTEIPANPWPSWQDLAELPIEEEIRYLLVNLTNPPTAQLLPISS
jgi:hypothetical protein